MTNSPEPPEAEMLPVRRAGRVLLVDGERRLLLFQSVDLLLDRPELIWFTPGGGLEPGEDFARGAARELVEETGLRVAPERLGQPVLLRRGVLRFEGVPHLFDEAYFYLPVERWEVDSRGFTDLERSAVAGHRWWTLAELAQTAELVFPEPPARLAGLVRQLIDDVAAARTPQSW